MVEITFSSYVFSPLQTLFVHDAPRKNLYDLSFHVKNGDYFGLVTHALSTVMEDGVEKHRHLLEQVRDDMRTLHKTHRIVPRDEQEKL